MQVKAEVKEDVIRQIRAEDETQAPLAKVSKQPSFQGTRGSQMVEAAKKKHQDVRTSKIPVSGPYACRGHDITRVRHKAGTGTQLPSGKAPKIAKKEINLKCLGDSNSGEFLARGTYGKCYLTTYRGMRAVVKEVKRIEDARQEGAVLQALPDNWLLPFLFGISPASSNPPFLVMQFHGIDSNNALNLHQAAEKLGSTIARKDWVNMLLDTVGAVSIVHKTGYFHNDIKGNNVMVENIYSKTYTAVLIDFGKARKISDPKIYHLSEVDKALYKEKFKHIAPEILEGHPQSFQNDVYSLGMVIKKVAKRVASMKDVGDQLKSCVSEIPDARPCLNKIKITLKSLRT